MRTIVTMTAEEFAQAGPEDGPFRVNCAGFFGAEVQDGPNKGLPWALARTIGRGALSREEVDRRGWEPVLVLPV